MLLGEFEKLQRGLNRGIVGGRRVQLQWSSVGAETTLGHGPPMGQRRLVDVEHGRELFVRLAGLGALFEVFARGIGPLADLVIVLAIVVVTHQPVDDVGEVVGFPHAGALRARQSSREEREHKTA